MYKVLRQDVQQFSFIFARYNFWINFSFSLSQILKEGIFLCTYEISKASPYLPFAKRNSLNSLCIILELGYLVLPNFGKNNQREILGWEFGTFGVPFEQSIFIIYTQKIWASRQSTSSFGLEYIFANLPNSVHLFFEK